MVTESYLRHLFLVMPVRIYPGGRLCKLLSLNNCKSMFLNAEMIKKIYVEHFIDLRICDVAYSSLRCFQNHCKSLNVNPEMPNGFDMKTENLYFRLFDTTTRKRKQ